LKFGSSLLRRAEHRRKGRRSEVLFERSELC
jgi:hypothetical protein